MMIAPTGITISFGGDRRGTTDSRPVVARIFGFPFGEDEPITHQMVVPAGETVEQPLPQGLYNVELTLSSGRIIQRNVTINEDTNENYRFFEDFAAPGSFSLQDAVGRSGDQILAEAAAVSSSTDPDAPDSDLTILAPTHAPGGRKGFVRRFGKAAPGRVPPITVGKPARLALRTGWSAGDAVETPAFSGWTEQEASERQGARAIWRVTDHSYAPPTAQWRKWARIERPDGGVEIASLPLPWFCMGSNGFSDANILVDPDRFSGASTTVAIDDQLLSGLLAFLDRGQAGAARPLLESLESDNVIEETIREKGSNPLAACAAAYVGLAVYPASQHERWDVWLQNCMKLFPEVPDAAIVHARRLILRPTGRGDNQLAAAALRQACAAGIPYFSAGVFLLREMLLQLSSDHADFVALAEQAGRVAGRVDASQAFTVLRYAPPKDQPK